MKKLLRNITAVGAADAGVRLIGFATTAYLGRTLGSEGFGLLGMGLAVAGYLFLIASPGVHVTGTRDIAAKKGGEGDLVSTILSLRMVLAPALLILVAAAVFLGGIESTAATTVIVSSAAIVPMALSLDWYFQGKEQFVLFSSQKLINALVFLVAVLVMVRGPGEAALAAAAFVAGTVGASAFSYLAYRRQGRVTFVWDLPAWRRMMGGSSPIALSSLLGQTANAFPVLVAGALLSAQDAGQMNAATKLVLLALIADRIFATLFLPALSRASGAPDRSRTIRLGLKIMIMIAAPLTVAGWALAPFLISVVYGAGFEPAIAPFRILLIYLGTTLVNSVFVAALIVAHRERLYFNIMLAGSFVTAAVALSATPLAGISGTAAGVSAGEVIMTALFLYVLQSGGVLRDGKAFLPFIAAAGGMALVAGVVSEISVFLAVACGLVLYAIVLIVSKAFTCEDVRSLREAAG